MAWLDLDARTAGIYDSLPSQEGEAGAARIVREVIHMLPKSSSEGGQDAGKDGRSGSSSNSEGSDFWTVEHPAFARQQLLPGAPGAGVEASTMSSDIKQLMEKLYHEGSQSTQRAASS